MLWSFAHMPLGISSHNKMVLWPGCGGRAEFSLHTKNVLFVWFVVKKGDVPCNLSGGVALIVWFTRNGMYSKNNTVIYVARASNSKRDCNAGSVLLLAATMQSFAHMPLGISDHKSTKSSVCHPLSFWQTCALHSYTGFSLCQLKQENATIILIIII